MRRSLYISFMTAVFFVSGCVTDNDAAENGETISEDAVANESEDIASNALAAEEVPAPDAPELPSVENTEVAAEEIASEAAASEPAEAALESDNTPVGEPIAAEVPEAIESAPDTTANVPQEVSEPAAPVEAATEEAPIETQAMAESAAVESTPSLATDESNASVNSESSNELGEYVVRPGDSLSKIAMRIYGTSAAIGKLVTTNGLENPNLIFPGDVLKFEKSDSGLADATPNSIQNPKSETVVVQKGDTLSKIAEKLLGAGGSWKYLWRLNQDKLADPNRIAEGTTLTLTYPSGNESSSSH